MDDKAHGIEVTLIDLGLARMETGEGKSVETLWTPFDDETFDGKGQDH
jgi:serine/threonine-protein kinase haspin